MNKTKKITTIGILIALYVVLAMTMKIPLLAGTHLQTDLGYIVFGVGAVILGPISFLIGTIGCLFESLIFSGWIPFGWMLGQVLIGIMTGYACLKIKNNFVREGIGIVAVFLGVACIKTGVECTLYGIPLAVKFAKNFVAFMADSIPFVIGIFLGDKVKPIVEK